jgi:hypothetical protein
VEPLKDYERMADALRCVLQWILGKGNPNWRTIARRTLAFVWVLRPDLLSGATTTAMAKRLHMTQHTFILYTAQVRKLFGVSNRMQAGWVSRARSQCLLRARNGQCSRRCAMHEKALKQTGPPTL